MGGEIEVHGNGIDLTLIWTSKEEGYIPSYLGTMSIHEFDLEQLKIGDYSDVMFKLRTIPVLLKRLE
ncbi:MAG: hypothetical protein ACI85I_001495 [Arenicella sp.]